ncbi:Cysteine-rich PDZ-binding protein [Bienertia sinuspersici]
MICKQQVHQEGKYCHTCAYSKGVCAMCGKQVLDTKFYKQRYKSIWRQYKLYEQRNV